MLCCDYKENFSFFIAEKEANSKAGNSKRNKRKPAVHETFSFYFLFRWNFLMRKFSILLLYETDTSEGERILKRRVPFSINTPCNKSSVNFYFVLIIVIIKCPQQN